MKAWKDGLGCKESAAQGHISLSNSSDPQHHVRSSLRGGIHNPRTGRRSLPIPGAHSLASQSIAISELCRFNERHLCTKKEKKVKEKKDTKVSGVDFFYNFLQCNVFIDDWRVSHNAH